jgi:IS66 C-terminal element
MIRCRPGLAPPTSVLANSAWRTNSCARRSPAWRAACLFTGRGRADERGNPTSPQTTSRSRSSSTCCCTTRRSAGILQADGVCQVQRLVPRGAQARSDYRSGMLGTWTTQTGRAGWAAWHRPRQRKAWLFAGSDRGGERAAAMYSLKLNDVDPRAWLEDVIGRIADHPVQRLNELLP